MIGRTRKAQTKWDTVADHRDCADDGQGTWRGSRGATLRIVRQQDLVRGEGAGTTSGFMSAVKASPGNQASSPAGQSNAVRFDACRSAKIAVRVNSQREGMVNSELHEPSTAG